MMLRKPNDETQALLARLQDSSRVPEVAVQLLEVLTALLGRIISILRLEIFLSGFVQGGTRGGAAKIHDAV